ncbi:MAG: hypothetical protein QMB24_02485, partial [Spirosomataceae bacterium]
MENNVKIQQLLTDIEFQKKLTRISVQKGISQVQATLEAETYLRELYTEHDTTTPGAPASATSP